MTAHADRLAFIHRQLAEGSLTHDEAADYADNALKLASPYDVRAAYWTGRIEEATGRELWPYET